MSHTKKGELEHKNSCCLGFTSAFVITDDAEKETCAAQKYIYIDSN